MAAIYYIAVHIEVSCLLELTLSTNSGSHTSQFRCGGHISYCSMTRNNVTNTPTENPQRTENRDFNYRGHSNPAGSPG